MDALSMNCLETQAIIWLTLVKFTLPAFSVECKRYNKCACHLSGASGGTIDLSSLANMEGKPAFETIDNSGNTTYQFNPCYGFTNRDSKGVCEDVSVCKEDIHIKKFQCLGKPDDMQFMFEQSKLYLQYNHKENIKTKILLQCQAASLPASLQVGKVNATLVQMTLSSNCACINGCLKRLSAGSVLCIVFISVVLIYFVVGMLYRKTVYEYSGWEVVPNHTFWRELPSLIKDGYMFFISPCLGNRVEYRHYERL